MRLASRLGQIRSEVKAFVDDRLTAAHIRASLAHALDTVFPPHRFDSLEDAPPEALINSLSMALPFEPSEKQALLEASSLTDRSAVLTALMTIDAAETGDGDAPSMQ